MLKARKVDNGISVYDPKKNYNYNFTQTSWEIIKAIKKHGKEKATQKIMKLFNIDEKNAKEDIQIILTNLKTLKLDINEIPTTASERKYAPRTVQLDITPRCNSKCIYCFSSDKMKDPTEMSTKHIINLLDELKELETWVLVISGGEPLLRKDIFEILEHVEKLNISFWFLTNGILIDSDVAKKLSSFKNLCLAQVSLDSCIPEHHDLHRGKNGAFKETVRGIKNLIKYGIIPEVEMVVTKANIEDIEETVEFLNRLGIKNVRIGPALTFGGRGAKNKKEFILSANQIKSTGNKIIELNEKYAGSISISPSREFLLHFDKEVITDNMVSCSVGKSTLYIISNGLVYPCLMTAHPKAVVGDTKKESLSQIWNNSDLLIKLRHQTKNKKNKCENCDLRNICNCLSKISE